jgi:inosine-uridine nucleoside N-ribohydrolase
MAKNIFVCSFFIFCVYLSFAQKNKPQAVIFDTDMGPDYDDVGAIALLHAYADSGYINIKATVASTNYEGVAGVLQVFNTYFNRPDLPIGVPKTNGLKLRDWQHWSDTLLAKYPHNIQTNEQVPEATEIYRKILAQEPDQSVTIITVGFFTNLANLLKTKGDQFSPLSGLELVRKKVKLLVSMAGKFPSGKEFNVEKDASSSQYVFSNWPTEVIFSGFEIGEKIKTGVPLVQNTSIQNSPVKEVFRICLPMAAEDNAGRKSWDETAVMVAAKGYSRYYTLKKGKIRVEPDGSNSWMNDGNQQAYLVEKSTPEAVQQYINKVMQHHPVKSSLLQSTE